MAKLTKARKAVEEAKIDKEVKKLPKRDGKTKRFNNEKARKGL